MPTCWLIELLKLPQHPAFRGPRAAYGGALYDKCFGITCLEFSRNVGGGQRLSESSWSQSLGTDLSSTVARFERRRQQELVKREVEPTAELEARIADRANVRKSEAFVQSDTRRVGRVDSGD